MSRSRCPQSYPPLFILSKTIVILYKRLNYVIICSIIPLLTNLTARSGLEVENAEIMSLWTAAVYVYDCGNSRHISRGNSVFNGL